MEKITQYCAICGNDDDDHLAGASLALLTMSIGGGDPTLARRAVVITLARWQHQLTEKVSIRSLHLYEGSDM